MRFDAIPRRTSSGRERTVMEAWEAESVRVVELDSHEVGQESANWTTELLGQQTGITVTHETVRVYLHAQRIIITAETLRRCSLMPGRTLRPLPAHLMTCFVILAALLHLASVLLNHRHLPHDQHQRFSWICFMSSTRAAATAAGSTNM